MKVFLTGATGFVGREIARQAHEAGHSLRLLARDDRSPRVQEIAGRFKAELHSGNILDAGTLEGSLKGCDAIIHLVGIISEVGSSTFENVHTRGTENIVRAGERAGVRRYIHMSALGTRPNAISRYHRSKWDAEEIVRRSALEFTIFRPSLIYGSEDHFINLFAKIIRLSPMVPLLGRRDAKFQPVGVEQVAAAFIRSLSEPGAVGKTFDLCGPETFTMAGMIDSILEVMRRKRLKVHVPGGVARFQAALLSFIFPVLLRKAPPLNRDQLLMLDEDNVGNCDAAIKLFGLQPPAFKSGIGTYLAPTRGWLPSF